MTGDGQRAAHQPYPRGEAIRRLREISDGTALPPGAPTAEQLVREDRDGFGESEQREP